MCIHTHAFVLREEEWWWSFKELTRAVWGPGRCEIHRAGQQSGNSGKGMKAVRRQNSFLFGAPHSFL